MSFESILRNDLISQDLLEDPEKVKVISDSLFDAVVNSSLRDGYTTTPGVAKNIIEVADLIRQVIINYEERTNIPVDQRASFVYESPDKPFGEWIELDENGQSFSPLNTPSTVVTISVTEREPGMFSQGSPKEGKIKNRRPVLREIVDDPDHPGYKRAIFGYFYDNTICLTVWNRTNKVANEKALWLEGIIEEYTWFFVRSGVNRILYSGWRPNLVFEDSNERYYGRPMDFFVRTEKLWNVSQKVLEEIVVRFAISQT